MEHILGRQALNRRFSKQRFQRQASSTEQQTEDKQDKSSPALTQDLEGLERGADIEVQPKSCMLYFTVLVGFGFAQTQADTTLLV